MPTGAFFLVLGSAVLHASWNLIMKRSGDRLIASWAIVIGSAVACIPFAPFVGLPPRAAWGYVFVSSLVHVIYASALAAAYDRADLSVAYPIARGVSPALVAVGGVLFLDDRLDGMGWTGVALTTAGLLVVAITAVRAHRLEWAFITGLIITTYTLIDAAGVRAGDDSAAYTVSLFLLHAAVFTPVIVLARGLAPIRLALAAEGGRMLAGGALGALAYALVLSAARIAPIGGVSAVRETSVIFGALGGWLLLGEDFGLRRTLGAAVVAGGVVLLALA